MGFAHRNIPSLRALLAFESVARLGNVTRAADELNTSQSAISRHIKQIETDLGVELFRKSGRGIALTRDGITYADDVKIALDRLRSAGARFNRRKDELTIACTHEVSHLLIMPHFSKLRSALGSRTNLRVLTCEYETAPAMIDVGADVLFEYREDMGDADDKTILREEIIPFAAPDFIEENAALLERPPGEWRGLKRLALIKGDGGWATWEDWFAAQGVQTPSAPEAYFNNYVYALEAATRAEGVVLGWRGFMNNYVRSGQLVPLREDWQDCQCVLRAVLTEHGESKRSAQSFVRLLRDLSSTESL